MLTSAALLLCATLAQSDIPEISNTPIELAVMSFNIRYGTANDGDNAWPKRRETVANTIKEYKPSIVGLQECIDFQAMYLEEEIPGYRFIGMGREVGGEGEHSAILYNTKILAPMETGNVWLSEAPDLPGSRSWYSSNVRMTTWARFYHRETGRTFYFFNTHLDHRKEKARIGQAGVLLECIQAVPKGAPVLLTGDFNAKAEDSKPYDVLTGGGMKDAWLEAVKTKGPEVTFNEFGPPDTSIVRRIDWILARGPIDVNYCETVTYNESGRYPSDHLPIFARVTLKP
jgi:endonuclease/exonuclease/phosphatase family metal-dependent hydrolase